MSNYSYDAMLGSPVLTEFLIDKADGRSTVRLFVATPTPLEENNLGRLFAIMEIDSTDAVNNDIVDVIAHALNTHYYQAETFEIESAFEFALQKTNHKLQELISEVGEEWLSQFNVIVGVQKEKKMIFTHLGKVIAMMIHKGNSVDIVDSAQSKAQDINPVKIFGHVVSGEIPAGSVMIFATETILNYLSKEKIKRVLLDHAPEFAVREFHGLLEDDTTNTNFAALIINREAEQITSSGQHTKQKAVYAAPTPSSSQHDSMIQLRGKEHQTEELLTPSIWPSLKKTMQQAVGTVRTKKSGAKEEAFDDAEDPILSSEARVRKARGVSTSDGSVAAVAMRFAKIGGTFLLTLFGWLKQGVVALIALVNRRKSGSGGGGAVNARRRFQRPTSDSIGQTLGRLFSRVVHWFQSLTVIQKGFFIVAVVVFLIFAQSVISRGEQKVSSDQEEQYAQTLADIDLKITDGTSALLFDKETARNAFAAAQELLNSIPQESKAYKNRGEELSRIITEKQREANGVVTLNNPTASVDFSSVSSTVGRMILLGRSIYAFDENNSAVYRHNLEDQKTTVALNADEGTAGPRAVSKASVGTGVSIMKDQTFTFFSPLEDAFTPLSLTYSNTRRTIVDIGVYGTRLYTLDTENNQVFRHQKTSEETFGAGSGWVTDSSVDLRQAVSFAIDGNIYVLMQNGSVVKLTAGKKEPFTLGAVDPALDSATKIFTEENAKNVYILDPSDKRMVVFDKTGKLVAQYQSESFTALKDMVVDEPNKKAYLLNGTQVFTVDLP